MAATDFRKYFIRTPGAAFVRKPLLVCCNKHEKCVLLQLLFMVGVSMLGMKMDTFRVGKSSNM